MKMVKIFILFFFTTLVAFQLVKGESVEIGVYQLKNDKISVKLTNLGATVLSILVPDKHGRREDIVLGYDSVDAYFEDSSYFGSIVGRVANRIGHARFKLDGTLYRLVANEGKNTLNGGSRGFNRVVWRVRNYEQSPVPRVTFIYHSRDGEQGFPGDIIVTITYTLTDLGLSVAIKAIAKNKPTPVNLAQHIYWNLGGHDSGNILSHKVQINGSHITPVDRHLIPTGKIVHAEGTPYDFLRPHAIKSRIKKLRGGYNINYVLNGKGNKLEQAAKLYDKKSGRVLEIFTTAPCLQLYTGDDLKNVKGKGGQVYKRNAGLVLATQGYPDAVNHPNFPSQIVEKRRPYKHYVLYKFSTTDA
ncbi:hypothetical protein Tsubulata_038593 [Turnera subulata]|uniref:Aldose 1-epimerase n=1 Tax=Turnera subulata TaxID=218843 RepID=A0A9Q0GBR5_9ROSI|nr:hypothetical protein Tsubulata_038593 [Turnera subulata]